MTIHLHHATGPFTAMSLQGRRSPGSVGLPAHPDGHLAWRREMERLQVAAWFPRADPPMHRPAAGDQRPGGRLDRRDEYHPAPPAATCPDGIGHVARQTEAPATSTMQARVPPDAGSDGGEALARRPSPLADVDLNMRADLAFAAAAPGTRAVDRQPSLPALDGAAGRASAVAQAPRDVPPRLAVARSVDALPPASLSGLAASPAGALPGVGAATTAARVVWSPGASASVPLGPGAQPLLATSPAGASAPVQRATIDDAMEPGTRGAAVQQKGAAC